MTSTKPPEAPKVEPSRLAAKLAEVMAAVGAVPKKGHNDQFNYDFVREADVVEAVRAELAKRHVALVPRIVKVEDEARQTAKGNTLYVTRAEIVFTFLDGESGELLECPWVGYGSDTQEKGLYKALTGAKKYFLLTTFLLATGDDPENDRPRRSKPDAAAPAPSAEQLPLVREVLRLAHAIVEQEGAREPAAEVIRRASEFTGKEGKAKSFSDPTRVTSEKWLAGTAKNLRLRLDAALKAQAAAAKPFVADDSDVPF